MFFVDKLINMGAQITLCDPHRAVVCGPSVLHGDRLVSPDVRAGMAMVIAASAAQAVERVGMPEAQLILSQAVIYMACAPKSNSATNAIFFFIYTVRNTKTPPVPTHLQDAHYNAAAKLGHGIGYKYAHNYPNHYVEQQYLPTEILGEKFYELSDMGYEKTLKEHMKKIKG